MIPFQSHSQAGQDVFVKRLLIDTERPDIAGYYFDIGCNHPFDLSNTFALEQQGWRGLLMDNDAVATGMCERERSRKNVVFLADSTKFDFTHWREGNDIVDYLSLDVDFCTSDTLTNILSNTDLVFRVATIEHDAWRFGPAPREYINGMMREAGYELICDNVCNGGQRYPFESWFVHPEFVDMNIADKFRAVNQEGLTIVSRP